MNCPTSSMFVLYRGKKNSDRHWFKQEADQLLIVECSEIRNAFTEWGHVGKITVCGYS